MLRFLIIILLAASTARSPQARGLIRYEDSRVSMACTYAIVVYGDDVQPLRQAVNAAFDEVDRVDRLMSHYKPDSPLSRLNRAAARQSVKVEPELFDFIVECLRYSTASEGAFDITVGPLMKAWGFFAGEGRFPAPDELAAARRAVGHQHVIVNADERTIYFDRTGVELDLGGIAKGYAVDRAAVILKQRGIASALISAGGSTIYGMGAPPNQDGWEVEIQDPMEHAKIAATVRLKDRALSVSGGYEKFFEHEGVRYSHVMDPRSGRPVEGVLSVAVVSESGLAGDALDNVFYVQGVEWSRRSWQKFPVFEIIFFLPEGGGSSKMIRWSGDSLRR
jgi:thiamine biosynthesis lipoprotein